MAASPPLVIIGPADHILALKARAGGGESALTFVDGEPLRALQAIVKHRPDLVIMERYFAATPRGSALIKWIKADPNLARAEIRVLAHDGSYTRTIARRTPETANAGMADAEEPASLTNDPATTRRVPRFAVGHRVEIQVDGNPATLVDLSAAGAQVLLSKALRPEQRVRVALVNDQEVTRLGASVAWVRFEVPRGRGQYRAGLEFREADPATVEAFLAKHKLEEE